MPMSYFSPKSGNQAGFTLIEVLIAVVVLSIGLLGLASLQMTALRFVGSAESRGQATYLAYDIIDRMRANKSAADTGDYDTNLNSAPTAPTDCGSTTANCDASTMAVYDLSQWKCMLGNWSSNSVCSSTLGIPRGLLPDGDASISRSNDIVTVTITWTDRDSNPLSLSVSTQL